MNRYITVNSDLKTKRRFMHISDAHIAIDDEARTRFWTPQSGILPLESLKKLLHHADEKNYDAVFITGDAIDYKGDKNIACMEELFKNTKTDVIYVYGNHEGDICGKTFYRDYKNLMGDSPDFILRDYGDLLVIGIDDSDVSVHPEQLDKLKKQLSRGIPVILLLHIPIENDDMNPWILEHWDGGFIIGKEEDSDTTKEFCSLVKSHPLIKAVFAGHIHEALSGKLSEGKYEYTAAPAFTGFFNDITVV